uniref:Uncharacterized protein n=1 Tax=Hyaloperonospora arabidopsidis (strain Emoy2) TaxID=559515 RepID=M4BP50_HYAAE
MSPVMTPFALVKMRPVGIKLFVQPENAMAARNESLSLCNVQVGRWTKQEHAMFLEGLQRFGRSWKKIASLVHSRTLVQIRTHAQKYLLKQSRAGTKADTEALGAGTSHLFQPRSRAVPEQHTVQTKRQWRSSESLDREYKVAPCFISQSQFSLTSTSRDQTTILPRSTSQFKNAHEVDQLSQDDSVTIPAFIEEYYTSPTAIEDDLLRSLSTGKEWVPRSAQCSTFVNSYEICRPVESTYPVVSGIPTSAAAITSSSMRPVVPNATSESLSVPTSPCAYPC